VFNPVARGFDLQMGFSATQVGIRLTRVVTTSQVDMTAARTRATALVGEYVTGPSIRFWRSSTDFKTGLGEPYESVVVQNAQDRWSEDCYGSDQCLESKGRDDMAIASHHSTEYKTVHRSIRCKTVRRPIKYSAINRSNESGPAFVNSGIHSSA
jgi:hypothetical protein